MKLKLIGILSFLGIITILSSCLDGDPINADPSASSPFLLMTNNPNGSGIVSSGLQYFGNQSLLYPPSDEVDTAVFAVSLQGVTTFDKDINVTLTIASDALDDNFANDGINYQLMPETFYEIINTTGVIKAGERYAEFKVRFFPIKINWKLNTMLPLTVTNDAGLKLASNFAVNYYPVVGNAIAGVYNWDFTRCSTPDCSAGPDGFSFTGHSATLAPTNPTTVRVPTGYYTGPDYIITFDDDGNGNLSNFKAILDPVEVNGTWASAGIVVVTGPTIVVENNYTKFTLHYTTATRNVTDVYYK